MKKFIHFPGLFLGAYCLSISASGLSSDKIRSEFLLLDAISTYAENAVIDPPRISFSPDTLDGGGTITLHIEIDDPEQNFSGGYLIISRPDGLISRESYFYYSDDVSPSKCECIVYLEINEYDQPGYWFVNSITLYYADNNYVFNASDLNSGFYVINTVPDSTPPEIKCLEVSKDTAHPYDTVKIQLEANGTGSGLNSVYVQITDFKGTHTYYSNSLDYYQVYKKIDTILIDYVIGRYEIIGPRRINISINDRAGNQNSYTELDLDFNLAVSGTVEDATPPTLKRLQLINNSDQGEIWLEVFAADDISGINNFSVQLNTSDYGKSYSYDYYPVGPYTDFIKINDSLYRCNLLTEEPYFVTGHYQLTLNFNDNAGNYRWMENYQSLYISNVNSDSQDPRIMSVTFDKDTLIAGDIITATIILSDDRSGLKSIYGSLFNRQRWQSIYFDHDYPMPGIKNDTLKLSFYLPEYGMSGLWSIRIMDVTDYSDKALFDYYTERPDFFFYPKYVDTIPPVFKSLTIDPDEVHAGDTVTITVTASDNLSAIASLDYTDDYLNSYDILYAWGLINTWFMSAPDTYKLRIPISEYAKPDTVTYELASITDAAENSLYPGKHGPAYIIISSGKADTLPPVFDSLYIPDTLINPEDTLTLIFTIHDDKSGINPDYLACYFGHNTDNFQSSWPDLYEYFDLIVFPRFINDHQYIAKLSASFLDSGTYALSYIIMADKAGNYTYPASSYDYRYLDYHYTFRVTGNGRTDSDGPFIENIHVMPRVVGPGDTVLIEITALAKGSGIASASGILQNTCGVESAALSFKEWEITGAMDTVHCMTHYVIPAKATSGKWILKYAGIMDYFRNESGFEYGIDLFDPSFIVTGGQTYPNRPPTWVIPEINLIVNAGSQLHYKIPAYIVNDIDGDSLDFSAVLKNGNSLLSWMGFSSANISLTLNPVTESAGHYSLYVIASDPDGMSDSIPVNIEVKPVTSIDIPAHQSTGMKVFPNPARDFIQFSFLGNVKSVRLYDLRGNKVYESHVKTDRADVSVLEEGLYILAVETDRGTRIEKINVVRR